MYFTQRLLTVSGLALASLFIGPVYGQDPSPKPDNTTMNKRDRDPSATTADQAKNNMSDREIMQKIRRAVVSDKSLSMYAHNIKIVSQQGNVTLKGPVHTDDEKKAIEAKATEIAGAGRVTDEITVKGDSK